MLTHLIALGFFAASSGGGGSTETGTVIASSERTAIFVPVQGTSITSAGTPLGAAGWRQPYDPADHTPYAMDFSELLDDAEGIAEILSITMSATAPLLGVQVDEDEVFDPIIDTAGKKIQLWFVVDEEQWSASSFNAGGVQLAVSAWVETNATPPKRYERTAILTVRQL